jgi:hypothetical protein
VEAELFASADEELFDEVVPVAAEVELVVEQPVVALAEAVPEVAVVVEPQLR